MRHSFSSYPVVSVFVDIACYSVQLEAAKLALLGPGQMFGAPLFTVHYQSVQATGVVKGVVFKVEDKTFFARSDFPTTGCISRTMHAKLEDIQGDIVLICDVCAGNQVLSQTCVRLLVAHLFLRCRVSLCQGLDVFVANVS